VDGLNRAKATGVRQRYPRRRQRHRGLSMSDARIRHMILFIIAFVSVAIWLRLGLLSYMTR